MELQEEDDQSNTIYYPKTKPAKFSRVSTKKKYYQGLYK